MSKMIKTTNTDIAVETSTTLVVEIGEFCFEVDERFPWINVYRTVDFTKREYVTEINEDDMPIFLEHEELKRYCLNWYFNNVEVVTNEELERTAQEVPVQEQYVTLKIDSKEIAKVVINEINKLSKQSNTTILSV